MSEISKKAVDYFEGGFCCSESVLLAAADSKNIKSDLIPKIATGFCGGLSKTGGVCGALAGAIMAVNMDLGRNDTSLEQKNINGDAVRKLVGEFEKQFGSTLCPVLKTSTEACRKYVEVAAELVGE